MNGTILSIWIKRSHGGPMDNVESAELIAGHGIAGNANQGGRRQVTVISEEAWKDTLADLGATVDPSARRANVLVRGLDLEQSQEKTLRLGGCTIRLLGETRPCELMDEMKDGLRSALRPAWRGGAYGAVLEGGEIRVGDPAALSG
ncbi:MAG TPA: MOSC domain-containing protein [Thermoanaerobaculia bacterium]|nr:MOSC domain-containing protein [Thermoanaerobaculia bacterium]